MTEQDYRRLFERVEPAPALVERTLSAAGARPRRRHPVRRAAALVVAGALLAGLSASFAAVKPVSPNVVTLETWTASGLGVPIGESDSDLGWTVSVDGVASDRWYAYILCTLSRDDGNAMTAGHYGFGQFDFGLESSLDWSASIQWLEDSDPADNQVPFAISLNNQDSWDMTGTTIHLTLNGLSTTSRAESWALLAMGGGQWELEFPLPAESQVQEFTPDLEFQVGDKTAILETVHCTPLEMWAAFTSQDGAFARFNPTLEDFDRAWCDENTPIFVLTDGTEWAADGWGGGQGDGGYWYNSYRCEDKRPLNPADVVGLRIGENVYPLTLE